jgi:hypothetical protein
MAGLPPTETTTPRLFTFVQLRWFRRSTEE